ncbi:MAG: sugar phosphate isomerase/epimerase family protein [Phycisphaerales bacterium]
MQMPLTRRDVIVSALAAGAALAARGAAGVQPEPAKPVATTKAPLFTISLAEWSLHKAIFAGEMTNMDFPRKAKEEFGIDAVEYVNQFFKDRAKDAKYLKELDTRCKDLGVTSVLIMCDGEGALGDADEKKRTQAVENHYKWADAAKALGCHSIRVNAQSSGTWDEQRDRAADGLRKLTEYGAKLELNVIVENHGGLSSNGEWLAATIKKVDHPRCGTLPDFGNFALGKDEKGEEKWYDRYKGVEEMMPFAKAVSAKSHEFDDKGEETKTDYTRMMKIVVAAGYKGRVGVEYEGGKHSETDGVKLTKALLERVREKMMAG